MAVPALVEALARVRRGWCRGFACVDARGIPPPFTHPEFAVAWSLDGALSGGIEAEFARRLLRRMLFEHSLPAWNDHPLRTKRQVIALLTKAIRGEGREGGWRVNNGPLAGDAR